MINNSRLTVVPTGFRGNPARTKVASKDPGRSACVIPSAVVRVRDCYIRERSSWMSKRYGGPISYQPPNKYNGRSAITIDGEAEIEKASRNEWLTLLQWCNDHEIPAEEFICVVFESLPASRTRCPEPSQLRTEAMRELWDRNKAKIEWKIRVALKIENDTAQTNIRVCRSLGDVYQVAIARTVLSSRLALSPLFRYCLAKLIPGKRFEDIADRYLLDAILQYRRYPEVYSRVWSSLLPKQFSVLAQKADRESIG